MNDAFASLFEWWGLIPFYSVGLGIHLQGYDKFCKNFNGTPWYTYIGVIMILSTLFTFALFYYIIRNPRFNRAWNWWIMALILFIINFSISFSIPYNDISSKNICPKLNVRIEDCLGFAFSVSIWSVIILMILTITPLRKGSINCRNTTFWKP